MVECRHCRAFFETLPEKIGSRCPDCHMPLFERYERSRREVESGTCVNHPDQPGITHCKRCHKRLCSACRTRWHDDNLCVACVENSVAAGETHPRELKARQMHALRGFILALVGAFLFLLGLGILYSSRNDAGTGPAGWSVFLMLVALIPAAIALGQGAVVVLARGPLFRLAGSAVTLASSQIGVTMGLLLVNFWRN